MPGRDESRSKHWADSGESILPMRRFPSRFLRIAVDQNRVEIRLHRCQPGALGPIGRYTKWLPYMPGSLKWTQIEAGLAWTIGASSFTDFDERDFCRQPVSPETE